MKSFAKPNSKAFLSHLLFRNKQRQIASYLFASLPAASANVDVKIRITDRLQRLAISDGTNWRFSDNNAIVT